MLRRSGLAALVLVASAAFLSGCGSLGSSTVHAVAEFTLPTGSQPTGIAGGSDSNIWFCEAGTNKIGVRFRSTGSITEYSTGLTASAGLGQMISVGDYLYFVETNASKIGRIHNTDGTITEYATPSANAGPISLCKGPSTDANAIYVLENTVNKIARFDLGTLTFPSGQEYTIPTASCNATSIATGDDNNLYFTEFASNKIGQMTPWTSTTTPAFVEFTTGITASSGPYAIAYGGDSAMYFSEKLGNRIGRITTNGTSTITPTVNEYSLQSGSTSPAGITLGPDNNLWFVMNGSGSDRLGQILTGSYNEGEAALKSTGANALFIATGADSYLWWSENGVDKLGFYKA